MNILITVTNMTAANGGVTTHIVDLCRELCNRENRVVLVSDENNCDYQKKIEELAENSSFRFVHCPMSGIQSNLKNLLLVVRRMCSIVKEEKIDIIHTHSQSMCIVGAMVKAMTGVPYLWTNHIDEMANPRLFRKIIKILKFPILSVSSDLKQMLVKDFGVDERRITVVNNGINPDNFFPMSENEKCELKNKYNCENQYVVSLLARMSWGKGHKYLLEAINKIQVEYGISDIKVLIAGKLHDEEKNYLDELLKYAAEHNIDMLFLGFQNPRDVFGIADIGVLPSLFEGFPLTVLEALIMKCPVIRSDTPGWMDTKDISFVFPKKDVDAFAEYLYYAYTHRNEMKEMGERGRKTVLEKFTISHQVDQTIEVYRKIIT